MIQPESGPPGAPAATRTMGFGRRLRKTVLLALPTTALVVVLVGAVHEFGHCLAVWLTGGRVVAVEFFFFLGRPETVWAGTPGRVGEMLITAGGGVFNYLIGVAILPFLPRLARAGLAPFLFGTSLSIACAMWSLTWAAFPLLHLAGWRIGDDSIHLIVVHGVSPAWFSTVSLAAMLLYVFSMVKQFRRSLPWLESAFRLPARSLPGR